MAATRIAPGKHQVVNVARVQDAVRNSIRRGALVPNGSWLAGLDRPKARRVVIVHGPAAMSDGVLKGAALSADVVLVEHIVAHIAATLALGRQELHPVQSPVGELIPVLAMVLEMIPDAIGDLEQFIPQLLSIVDTVVIAAQFNPPVTGDPMAVPFLAIGQVVAVLKGVGPLGRHKGLWHVVLAREKEDRHAHRLFVGLLRRDRLVELAARLAPDAIFGAGHRGQHPIARAIGKHLRPDGVARLCSKLPARDADDAVALHLCFQARAVEQRCQVGQPKSPLI